MVATGCGDKTLSTNLSFREADSETLSKTIASTDRPLKGTSIRTPTAMAESREAGTK
jgi:hypothetical protein